MVIVPHIRQSMSWATPMICVSGEGWADMGRGEVQKWQFPDFRCPEGLASPLPPWQFMAERITNWIANENYRKSICSSQTKIKLAVLFLTCLSCMYMQHHLYVTLAVYFFLLVLSIILKSKTPYELMNRPNMKETVEALIPYSGLFLVHSNCFYLVCLCSGWLEGYRERKLD